MFEVTIKVGQGRWSHEHGGMKINPASAKASADCLLSHIFIADFLSNEVNAAQKSG